MKTAAQMIAYYRKPEMTPRRWLPGIALQYINMARGGDGGKLHGLEGKPSCREYNYPGYPDSFFQEVCEGMCWVYLENENESQ